MKTHPLFLEGDGKTDLGRPKPARNLPETCSKPARNLPETGR
jgi:hypothetical protein